MEGWKLLLLIEHHSGYSNFPVVIQVCSVIRKKLIEQFKTVLSMIDTKNSWVDKLVLKMSEWYPALYHRHIAKVREEFYGILKHFERKETVVSGGALAQIIYEKSWDSDLDIFFRQDVESRYPYSGFDFVGRNVRHIEEVIASFDCSLVQVEYKGTDNELYVTPLFLIGYVTQKAFWCFSNCEYTNALSREKMRIHQFLLYHNHPQGPFFKCRECMKQIDNYYHWFKRIAKYKARFPDFDFCLLQRQQEEEIVSEPPVKKNKTDSSMF